MSEQTKKALLTEELLWYIHNEEPYNSKTIKGIMTRPGGPECSRVSHLQCLELEKAGLVRRHYISKDGDTLWLPPNLSAAEIRTAVRKTIAEEEVVKNG